MSQDIIRGPTSADLGNAVSISIVLAVRAGLGVDEAVSIVVAVAADYARAQYGNAYLNDLAEIITDRASRPLPPAGQ